MLYADRGIDVPGLVQMHWWNELNLQNSLTDILQVKTTEESGLQTFYFIGNANLSHNN